MADYARATTISSLGPLSKQAKAIIDNHLRIVGEEKAGLVECGKSHCAPCLWATRFLPQSSCNP